jgi:ribose transport system permease protein
MAVTMRHRLRPCGRQLDLSIGSNLVLSAVVAAKVLVAVSGTQAQVSAGEYPNLALGVVAGSIAAILAGTLFGLVNGLLVTRLRINSFIVTLGTMGIGTGLAYVVATASVANVAGAPDQLWHRKFRHRSYPMIVVLIISAALWYTLRAALRTLCARDRLIREAAGRRHPLAAPSSSCSS